MGRDDRDARDPVIEKPDPDKCPDSHTCTRRPGKAAEVACRVVILEDQLEEAPRLSAAHRKAAPATRAGPVCWHASTHPLW